MSPALGLLLVFALAAAVPFAIASSVRLIGRLLHRGGTLLDARARVEIARMRAGAARSPADAAFGAHERRRDPFDAR
jgi:hypothetical protein